MSNPVCPMCGHVASLHYSKLVQLRHPEGHRCLGDGGGLTCPCRWTEEDVHGERTPPETVEGVRIVSV